MIGYGRGGLDDRILQVERENTARGPKRMFGLHELAYETCTSMHNYQLLFPRTC